MKRFLFGLVAMALLPTGVVSQTELGLDAGAVITRVAGSSLTTLQVPASALRVGFWAGDKVIFEPLVTFAYVNGGGSSATALELVPGLDFLLGEGGAYVRAEVAIAYASSGGSSNSDFGFGGGIGTRKANEDGTALVRVEGVVQRWPDEFAAATVIRLLVGFSFIVG